MRKWIWRIALIACICVMVMAGYNISTQLVEYGAAEQEYEDIAQIARPAGPRVTPETAQKTTSEGEGAAPYQSPIDFAALREINPDIVGWIYLEGTVIDYPIVQGDDNESYLHMTFQGQRNSSGATFMDYRNEPNFAGPNTFVYGHKMKNGSMFAALTEYQQQSFYAEHPIFTIYTPEAEYRCEIFSAYVTDSISETYNIDYPQADGFAAYLAYITERNGIQTSVAVTDTDAIVTLSTCDYQFENARMVVHAKITQL